MSKTVIQDHHIIYENLEHKQPEVKAKIFKGEHWVMTHLNRRKKISTGFLKSLRIWIALNEDNAINLDEEGSKSV